MKPIAHGDFSVCSLNTKSFYHGLTLLHIFANALSPEQEGFSITNVVEIALLVIFFRN